MNLRLARLTVLAAALLLLGVPATAVVMHGHKSSHATTDPHAGMSPERVTQIQTALIKNGYLSGEPSGKWDEASIAAMQKLQSDNGWQTKIVPDSRALIKLGLGPQSSAAASSTSSTN